MSLSNELQKLKSLRDSGGITQDEYDKSRNRLLEECVRRIETVHDLNPKACVLGQPPAAPRGDGEPRVRFSRIEPRPEATRPASYSGDLDYSLIKAPARRVPESGPATCAVAAAQVQSAESSRMEDAATVKLVTPPARVDEEPPAVSREAAAPRVTLSFTSHAVDLDRKEPACHIEVFEKEQAPAAAVASSPRAANTAFEAVPSSPRSGAEPDAGRLPAEDSSTQQAEEINDPLFEECVRRFETFYDTKSSGRDRWGLPRFKLVRGVVQDIRASMCQDSDHYAASVRVDGRRMAITSSSAIRIAAGDRISLGGYERDGELLVLAYRNDTNGICSDLSRLRKRYRFLLTIGLLILLAGLAALAATLIVFTHKPAWTAHFDSWGYLPYALSGLMAAAVSYLGLTLSFVGKWAKEFHKALAPADETPEPATYNTSSLPLALH